jgi:two-component system, NarL family, sensor histidine kinase UhpB
MADNYIKILLIENNSTDAEIIKSSLDQVTTFFALKPAVHISEGVNFLRQEEFDIVLLSLSLRDSDVFLPFEKVWEQASYIPIIALSDQEDEDIKIKLVKAGVQDYLIKGEIDGNLLTHSILNAIERNKILENLKRENIRLAFNIIGKEDSERRLKLALSNVQDIIIEIDNDNICTFMNNSGVNFLGDEILGNELKFFNWYFSYYNRKIAITCEERCSLL